MSDRLASSSREAKLIFLFVAQQYMRKLAKTPLSDWAQRVYLLV